MDQDSLLQQTHSANGYDMKCVYTAHNPIDAHLVKGLLEAEGIETVVRGEHLFPLRGIIPVTADTNPSVWVVNDADFDQARSTATVYDQGSLSGPLPPKSWHCPQCGEGLEGQFTACWKCGAIRPLS